MQQNYTSRRELLKAAGMLAMATAGTGIGLRSAGA